MNLHSASVPTWQEIKENHYYFSQKFLDEHKKRNGFVPVEPGFIYLIEAVGSQFYKIGKSIHPDKRILQISPKMPFETRLLCVRRSNFMSIAEKMLHAKLQDCRTNGEWFELDDTLLCYLTMDSTSMQIRYAYVESIFQMFFESQGVSGLRSIFKKYPLFLDSEDHGDLSIFMIESWMRSIDETVKTATTFDLKGLEYYSTNPEWDKVLKCIENRLAFCAFRSFGHLISLDDSECRVGTQTEADFRMLRSYFPDIEKALIRLKSRPIAVTLEVVS